MVETRHAGVGTDLSEFEVTPKVAKEPNNTTEIFVKFISGLSKE